ALSWSRAQPVTTTRRAAAGGRVVCSPFELSRPVSRVQPCLFRPVPWHHGSQTLCSDERAPGWLTAFGRFPRPFLIVKSVGLGPWLTADHGSACGAVNQRAGVVDRTGRCHAARRSQPNSAGRNASVDESDFLLDLYASIRIHECHDNLLQRRS